MFCAIFPIVKNLGRFSGLFGVVEIFKSSKDYWASVNADGSYVDIASFILMNAMNTCFIILLNLSAITAILLIGAYPEVLSTIVESVTIYMVNKHAIDSVSSKNLGHYLTRKMNPPSRFAFWGKLSTFLGANIVKMDLPSISHKNVYVFRIKKKFHEHVYMRYSSVASSVRGA